MKDPKSSLPNCKTLKDTVRLLYRPIETLEFPQDPNELTFEYVGLHYTNPSKNQYQYILENSDPDWILAGADRKACYTNLAPDKYTFKVRAINSEGIFSEEEAQLTIVIRPPW